MQYAYICRFPNDGGPLQGLYVIKYLDKVTKVRKRGAKTTFHVDIKDAAPPVLRRKRGGHSEWDYANAGMPPKKFHKLHIGIHLKPGEGPILVNLDEVGKLRTSKDPEDLTSGRHEK